MPRPPQCRELAVNAAGTLLALLCLYGSSLTLSLENQVILSAGLLAVIFLIYRLRSRVRDYGRVLIITLGAYLSLRYWFFRTTETLLYSGWWDFVFLVLLYLAETYGIFTHLMGNFVNAAPLRRPIPPLPADPAAWPAVDVFVPTYDEPPEIVRVTLAACAQLDYPREKLAIHVLDDGGTAAKLADPDPERAAAARRRAEILKAMAAELGVCYRTRRDNAHAKAGNINAALMATAEEGSAAELVLVLDSDHVPTRDFLRNTVGFFLADENLAFVQTPHFFVNPTPVERNLDTYRRSPTENEMFYGGVHLGLDFWNASFFCGSAAVLRRKHLAAVGGIACDTITEDAATALNLHSRGYNSIYLNKPMVMGLAPESFEGFVIQRSRWARGMTQILLLKNPLVQRGLTLPQRICYLNACLYWLFGFARVIFFMSPLLFIFFHLRIYNASLRQVVVYALPHLIASYFISNLLHGRLRHPFFSELYETIQSIYLVPAVLSVLWRPRSPRFRVTPKSVSLPQEGPTQLAMPFYLMFLMTLAAYPAAAWSYLKNPLLLDTVIICLSWNTFNMLLMLCCLGVVWEKRQLRRSHRYGTCEDALLEVNGTGRRLKTVIVDLSASGAGLRVPVEAGLRVGDRLTLIAADSRGRRYRLPMGVSRVQRRAGATTVGTRFLADPPQTFQQVVAFVFGDSRRWKYFHERAPRDSVSTLYGLLYLVRIGLRGTFRNFGGMLRLAARALRGRRPARVPADNHRFLSDGTKGVTT